MPAGTSGATAKGAGRPSRDDSPDSLPDLVTDPELKGTSAATPVGPNAKSPSKDHFLWVSPDVPEGQQIAEQLPRGREKESSASVEEDTIAEVDSDSDSDGEHPRNAAPPWARLMLAVSMLCAMFVWSQDVARDCNCITAGRE